MPRVRINRAKLPTLFCHYLGSSNPLLFTFPLRYDGQSIRVSSFLFRFEYDD